MNNRRSKTKIVEVTPYRLESGYSDFRHPDEVKFSTKIEDDFKRRDFTINAIAVSLSKGAIKDVIDLYGVLKDIKDKVYKDSRKSSGSLL
jgi:tRNA nucleotidyltransferase (CCA-adding enzyme)